MTYEKAGKKVNKDTGKRGTDYELRNVDTKAMLWHIVKRHKFAIVTVYAVVITIAHFAPFLPDMLLALF